MFYGGSWFIGALALSATAKPVLGQGHSVPEEPPAGHRSCTTLREVVSLPRNPCALVEEKVGQSWSNPALEPCPRVLGGELLRALRVHCKNH